MGDSDGCFSSSPFQSGCVAILNVVTSLEELVHSSTVSVPPILMTVSNSLARSYSATSGVIYLV